MRVPAEILAVPRPVNTVVKVYGKNMDHYSVVQRIGCVRKNGGNYPQEGGVIGHINPVTLTYEPKDLRPRQKDLPPTVLSWGNVILCDRLFSDILNDLSRFYTRKDALIIYCTAIIRVCWPHIPDNRIRHYYRHSFLSLLYPDVGLCKDLISQAEISFGSRYSVIQDFMRDRVSKIRCDDTLLIDGTLKTNDSYVNPFSRFSRKAKLKGRKDISVLYAYNLETAEPVCSKAFPGNMLDATAYKKFLESNHIEQGLMVDDKGFPPGQIRSYLKDKEHLHYLTPLKRNAKVIQELGLYEYNDTLPEDPQVLCVRKKGYLEDGTVLFYYSYKDQYLAAAETSAYAVRMRENDPKLSGVEKADKLAVLREKAGTIVFESDQDMTLAQAYEAFVSRWDIETMMSYYKTACGFDVTREQYTESVLGSEFIDFFSTLLSCRLRNYFQSRDSLKDYGYTEIMETLKEAFKIKPTEGEWILTDLNPASEKILYALELIDTPPEKKKRDVVKASMEEFKPKKRGRPKKEKDPNTPEKPKRPRGRPRKAKDPNEPEKPKRPRGRPRKNPKSEESSQS